MNIQEVLIQSSLETAQKLISAANSEKELRARMFQLLAVLGDSPQNKLIDEISRMVALAALHAFILYFPDTDAMLKLIEQGLKETKSATS